MSRTRISSKKAGKKPQTRNIVLADGTKVKTNNNVAPNIKKGELTKHNIPAKKFSTESGRDYEDYEINDDFENLEYPPPSRHPVFRKFWAEAVENITSRDNFEPAHLGLLETYCRIKVEIRNLDKFVEQNGHTFRVTTVLGEHRKTYPEVNERMKALSQLAVYSRLLGLVPAAARRGPKKKTDEEWE